MIKRKIIGKGKTKLTQYPKVSHKKSLVCHQEADPGGKVPHYQVNTEARARVEGDGMKVFRVGRKEKKPAFVVQALHAINSQHI